MLDYAANGQYYFDKESIREYLSHTADERDISLEKLIASLDAESGESVEDFLETIANNFVHHLSR